MQIFSSFTPPKLLCNHQCEVRFQHFQGILRQKRQQMFNCGHSGYVLINPVQPNIAQGRPDQFQNLGTINEED